MNGYISKKIENYISSASWIRKMFEAGAELKKKFGAENVFDFSLGNPDVPPPAKFFEILKNKSLEINPINHGYMPNAGYAATREKLAETLKKIYNAPQIEANNIIMTTGAAGAINIALKSILETGEEVIIIAPYFVEYKFYIDNHNGVPIVAESTENFDLDINELEKKITVKTRAIIINSPNNPTGKVYTKSNLQKLAELLEHYSNKHGRPIFIISDEPYISIVYENLEAPSLLNIYKNTIIANSYSKELSLPGERIGYALINPQCEGKKELFDALTLCNRICGFVNAPALMQRIIAELTDVKVNITIYQKRRDLFYDMLIDLGYELYKPEGAFYLFVKSPIVDDVQFVNKLLQYNILAVPGIGFGRAGYFRLAYCVNENVILNSRSGFEKAKK
ncbi:MAG TPA: pyridoxal phosphate-dependent aminotransferase [bacterium]|nr:pyridoxal phosphate-dependent aminotransferase [bacterium]